MPEFYLPIAQVPDVAWTWIQRSMYVIARTSGDPLTLARPIGAAVMTAAPGVPLFDTRTMDQRLAGSVATERFNTLLLTLLGIAGLLLSAIGIYGVLAYFVSNRTQEIGVRMALGASRGNVASLVVRQAAMPVGIGIALGCLAAAWAARALSDQLVTIGPHDPMTFAAVIASLVIVALAASIIPARRAASIDPTRALQGNT
jgi:ABC-type antimicrobial peptide transport system permease subunit